MNELINNIRIVASVADWRAFLDVLVISLGMFALYRTFRTTGTWKIVIGLFLSGSVFLLALLLDLRGIRWIFSNLSDVILIALLIIFQPELRRILEKAASIRRIRVTKKSFAAVSEVSESVFEMARRRMGAIIVYPGRETVEPWVAGGTKANAIISKALLLSIFDTKTPGHDGALIISGNNISSFGERLPISDSGRLSNDLGTRHHSSMGLAERTDALVITVSEERGEVSIFQGGRRRLILSSGALAEIVSEHLNRVSSIPVPVIKIQKPWAVLGQLAASTMLGVILWGMVTFAEGKIVEMAYNVPVEYTGRKSGMMIIGDKPDRVRVILAGTRENLQTVDENRLKVKINLSSLSVGENMLGLQNWYIPDLPAGVHLEAGEPSEFRILARPTKEVRAKIIPRFVGKLPGGLELESSVVLPDTIRVYVSMADLKETGDNDRPSDQEKPKQPGLSASDEEMTISTQPIDMGEITEDGTIRTRLMVPEGIWPVGGEWPEVEVQINVD